MRHFDMCLDCSSEYQDPADRRFHAQPNACTDCGPELWLTTNEGDQIETNDPILLATRLIHLGKIVAIKGIGGYQLVCDASNSEAVEALRARKNRPAKPFAVMAKNIEHIKQHCEVSAREEEALKSTAAPIVLLKAKDNNLAAGIAPGQSRLGFVLPYSPLHHLLMKMVDRPVIFTSGNLSQLPQCTDEQQAEEKLGHIVDAFLHHNRPISNRVDDSVISIYKDSEYFFRRSRGYAPTSLTSSDALNSGHAILACGSQMKNTFTLQKDNHLICSQYIGDLDNPVSLKDYLAQIARQSELFQINPKVIVVDKHPDYQSSRYGRAYAEDNNLEIIAVQHHHAHMAACMFDNNHQPEDGQIVALVLDGLGFGDDQSIWGGEILLGDYQNYQRVGALENIPMPGGTQAILEPWRMLLAHLSHLSGRESVALEDLLDNFSGFREKPVKQLAQMMDLGVNSPLTSSCGRLFDAVAAAIGICFDKISYEGQAAIELQQIAMLSDEEVPPYSICIDDKSGDLRVLNAMPMWYELIADLQAEVGATIISRRFHLGLATALSDLAIEICKKNKLKTIALCGGVFQNVYMLALCQKHIHKAGLNTYIHNQLPANDACVSVGQAIIAGQIKRRQG